MSTKIVPSVLPADYLRLGEELERMEQAGVDRIQWDVMDGVFVPNITFGPDVIAAGREACSVPFEAHIMAEHPEELFPRYVEAGCELIIVHPETLRQPHWAFQRIHELGAKAGMALSPGTPLCLADAMIDELDMILVMTVSPGFGGQSYLATMEPKIEQARALIDASGRDIDLEVDGGIGPETIGGAASAGANVFVSGSSLFGYDSMQEGVEDLRRRAAQARGVDSRLA